MAIDVVDTGHDAVLEFGVRMPPGYGARPSAANLEEALDQVEPGAVLGRERELEAAGGPAASEVLVSLEM